MTLIQSPPEPHAEKSAGDEAPPEAIEGAARVWRRGRLAIWIGALVLLVAGAAWMLWGSPWLRVDTVDVRGSSPVMRGPIEAAAAIEPGVPMIRVDTGAVQDRVSDLMEVQSVRVVRAWPGTIVVEVQERMPVGVVPAPGGETEVLGSDGSSMATVPTQPADLPELRASGQDIGTLTEAMSHLTREILAVTEWASLSDGRIELQLRNGAGTVVWGAPADNATKADVLAVLLISAPEARWFDLSSARAPVTALEQPTRGASPSAAPGNEASDGTGGAPGTSVEQAPGTTNEQSGDTTGGPLPSTLQEPMPAQDLAQPYGEQLAKPATVQQ